MALTDGKVHQNPLRDLDFKLLSAVFFLTVFGIILIYSADHAQDVSNHFTKQLYFALIGFILLTAFIFIPPRVYDALAYPFYGAALLGLLLVLMAGIIGFGARRWLVIGGINIQPSEPAKIAMIMVLAKIFSHRGVPQTIWRVIGLSALVCLPFTALVLVQPDLGTATVFPVITAIMLAWFGLPVKVFVLFLLPVVSLFVSVSPWTVIPVLIVGFVYLRKTGFRWMILFVVILICTVATFAAPVAWKQLEPYQQKRLTTFLNPSADPLGAGYQIIQSKTAIGSGGILGQGFLQGPQTQLRFLPEQHTDFIFALAGEEFGFIGTTLIVFLFILICWSGYRQAMRIKSTFMAYVCVGLTTMYLYHAFVNIGMAVGNLPVTGLPLPFLSYGGSFLITCLCSAGVLLSAGMHRREF